MTSVITRQPHLVNKKIISRIRFRRPFSGRTWHELYCYTCQKTTAEIATKSKKNRDMVRPSGFFAVTQLQPPKNKKKHGLSHNKKDIHQTWTTRGKLHLLTSQLQSIESTPKVLGKTWRFPRWLSHLSNRPPVFGG